MDLCVTVMLPHEQTGYYRGCRFDWSGMVSSVRYLGHTFIEQPFSDHCPEEPRHGIGTAEEFRACAPGVCDALGYPEAGQGDGFLKIGVGILKKGADQAYDMTKKYEFLQANQWRVDVAERSVEFRQDFQLNVRHGYRYAKTVAVDSDRPVLEILHALENTGSELLHINHYCHNFFLLDNQPVGPHYRVLFPFRPRLCNDRSKVFTVQNRMVMLNRDLSGSEMFGACIDGFNPVAVRNSFCVENSLTGVGVVMSADKPAVSIFLCAGRRFLSVEPQIEVLIPSGHQFEWTNRYQFYAASDGSDIRRNACDVFPH